MGCKHVGQLRCQKWIEQVQKGVEKPGGQLKVSKMDRAGPKIG